MNSNCPTLPNSPADCPIIADLHTHTKHSHAQHSVDEMYAAAKAKGIKILGFSEHSPRPAGYTYAQDYQESLQATFPDYIREVESLRNRAKQDGITVLLGLEADFIPGQEAYAEKLCKEYPFDYVIGGLHFQGTWGFDGPASEWDVLSREQRFAAYEKYYEDLASMCRTGLFQIAAHPDLIKIHSVDTFREWLKLPSSLDSIRKALQTMKECGVVMEISSAGLRKPCNEIYPGPAIMRIAAELELPISFGSDAHCINTPAFAFKELAAYAAGFGYATSTVVEQGKARALPFKTSS